MPIHPGPAYIVEASKDGQVEYWAAATDADKALPAVFLILGSDWRIRLTHRLLSADRVAAIRLRTGGVRRLKGPDE